MNDRQYGPPPLPLFLTEVGRAGTEFAAYRAALPLAPALPRGDGHCVLVLPGLQADDRSTRPLRWVLRTLGYDVHGWRLGRNIGPTARCVDGLRATLSDLHSRQGRPITLIGWSLGGIFARELARQEPSSVRQVITLASPFRMERPSQSRAQSTYERHSHLHAAPTGLPLDRTPLPMPATSLYSRLDGIVAWQACLDVPSERHENIQVYASHLGIGHHPATMYAVSDRLAQAEGTWARFRPPAILRGAFPAADAPWQQLQVSAAS